MTNNSFFFKTVKDSRFTLITGWVLGALINYFPLYAVILFSIIAIGVFIFIYLENRKELKQIALTIEEIKSLAAPDEMAVEVVKKTNQNLLVSGKVIEICWHPNLNSKVNLQNVGWNPNDSKAIEVHEKDLKFDAKDIITKAGGIIKAEPPNNKKYCLVNTPFVTYESPHLLLELMETDFFTIETAKKWIQDNLVEINRFGSLSLEKNKVPSSLCLHFTVRLAEGEILLMRRSMGMSYHESKWSASGEEQLSEDDLHANNPIENLFKRALGEEILILGGIENFSQSVKAIDEHIDYMRMYSIGIEWPFFNPTLFGFIQLKDNRNGLREKLISRKFGAEYLGQEDREGVFYTVKDDQAFELLKKGYTKTKGLFDSSEITIKNDDLHPTARYRIYRLLRLLNRNNLLK